MRPLLLVILFAVSSALTATPSHLNGNDPHTKQRKHLPKEFKKLYFGMSLDEFKKKMKKKVDFGDGDIMEFRIEGVQEAPSKRIKQVTYYFDNEPGYPLYEIIIEYNDTAVRDKEAQSLLGELGSSSEWMFESGEGFKIRAWTFGAKLVYAAQIDGTEWDPKK